MAIRLFHKIAAPFRDHVVNEIVPFSNYLIIETFNFDVINSVLAKPN